MFVPCSNERIEIHFNLVSTALPLQSLLFITRLYDVRICCEFILEQLTRCLRSTNRIYGLCDREWWMVCNNRNLSGSHTLDPMLNVQWPMLSLELIYKQLTALNDPINIDEWMNHELQCASIVVSQSVPILFSIQYNAQIIIV